jgi:hypothetical protein
MKILPIFGVWGGERGGLFDDFFSPKKNIYATKYSSLYYYFYLVLCKFSYKKDMDALSL